MATGDVLKSYWEKYPTAPNAVGSSGRGRPEVPHKTYNAAEEQDIELTSAQKAQNAHAEAAQQDHDEVVKAAKQATGTADKTTLTGKVVKPRKKKPFIRPLPANQTRGTDVKPTLQGQKYAAAVDKAHRLVSNIVTNLRGTNDPIVHAVLDSPIEGQDYEYSIQDHLDDAKAHHRLGLEKLAAGGVTQHEASGHFIDATASLEKAVQGIRNLPPYVKDHANTHGVNTEIPESQMGLLSQARSTARVVKPSAPREIQFGGKRIKPQDIDKEIDLEKAREIPQIMERINAVKDVPERTLAKDKGVEKEVKPPRRGRSDRRPVGSGSKVPFGKGTSGNNIANELQPVPAAQKLVTRGASKTRKLVEGLPGPSMPGRTPGFDATSKIPGDVPAAPSRSSVFTGASSSARGETPAEPVTPAEPKPGKGKGKK